MSKGVMTFQELIELIEVSFNSGKIGKDYHDFLKCCRDLGLSSYTLNVIIQKAKENQKDTDENNFDSSFFVIAENKLPKKQENKKEIQTITNLYKENRQLKVDYNKLLSQKKQYRNVVLLVLTVLVCGVCLLFLNGSLNDTKNELSHTKTQVSQLDSQVKNLNNELKNAENSLNITREERDKIQQKLNDLKSKVESTMPIIITDIQIANTTNGGDIETDYGNTIYSRNTMYLKPKITYTGIKTGENIDLNIKFYTPSGMSTGSSSPYGCSYSTSLYVYSGENIEALSGWGGASRGHWSCGTYRFEIWYSDVCLKSKSFTIY